MSDSPPADPRAIMLAQGRAALATVIDGAPYVSLVLVAFDEDGSPLLLLSDLAQHSRNIAADDRVSLLFDGAQGLADPLAGPRLTVLGAAVRRDDPAALERYVARHASAAMYAGFGDFRLYRVRIDRAHFVAGFGQIRWVAPGALLG